MKSHAVQLNRITKSVNCFPFLAVSIKNLTLDYELFFPFLPATIFCSCTSFLVFLVQHGLFSERTVLFCLLHIHKEIIYIILIVGLILLHTYTKRIRIYTELLLPHCLTQNDVIAQILVLSNIAS